MVAWISVRSSVGAWVERLPSTDSFTDDMGASLFMGPGPLGPVPRVTNSPLRLCDLVEKLLNGFTDALEASCLATREMCIGDVPCVRRDLVLDDPVFHLRAPNPRPPHGIAEQQIHSVGNLRREVVDVRVPLAIVGGGEEQLRVVLQENEAHVVDRDHPLRALELAFQELQQ